MQEPSGSKIYLEIAEKIMERIVEGLLAPGDKIPSVRETAMEMGVTPNTAAHAHTVLKDMGAVTPERGVGAIVTPLAPELCRDYIKSRFLLQELPLLKRRLQLLDISGPELLLLLGNAAQQGEKS